MRIGFVSLYSWRPHVEHLCYLADLVSKAGHEVEFLTCDSDLSTCYTRELRNIRADWQECVACRIGGVRSYVSKNVNSIGQYNGSEEKLPDEVISWALSSASTLGRFESDADFASEPFAALVNRFQPSVEKAYLAASNWIKDKHLDALVVFNGRMDATRAIFEAGLRNKIPVATLERTWFGDGLQIFPQENCLGLRSVDKLVSEWADKPLTNQQAKLAASNIASRFLRKNHNEWRAYNLNATNDAWPVTGANHKILLIPSSRNEFWGHSDWDSAWKHPLEAYDALIEHFKLIPADLVLRCHPNWGEFIGESDGRFPEEYYTQWANKRGISVIPSTSTVSTLGLIEQAEAVVISAGSAALEAGALGKQVIAIGPSVYQKANFRDDASSIEKLKLLQLHCDLSAHIVTEREANIRRQVLRFCYTMAYRVPQFVDYVKLETTTKYGYKIGADSNRLINLLQTGILSADDANYADNINEEEKVLELIKNKLWSELHEEQSTMIGYAKFKRRFPYTGVDYIRNKLRHGDR
jgi:hypothetical protein